MREMRSNQRLPLVGASLLIAIAWISGCAAVEPTSESPQAFVPADILAEEATPTATPVEPTAAPSGPDPTATPVEPTAVPSTPDPTATNPPTATTTKPPLPTPEPTRAPTTVEQSPSAAEVQRSTPLAIVPTVAPTATTPARATAVRTQPSTPTALPSPTSVQLEPVATTRPEATATPLPDFFGPGTQLIDDVPADYSFLIAVTSNSYTAPLTFRACDQDVVVTPNAGQERFIVRCSSAVNTVAPAFFPPTCAWNRTTARIQPALSFALTCQAESTPTPQEAPSAGVVLFESCAEVEAAGAAPILFTDPRFQNKLDADNDGWGCDQEGHESWG